MSVLDRAEFKEQLIASDRRQLQARRGVFERIVEELWSQPTRVRRVIDWGCGLGALVKLLAEANFQAVGVERSPLRLECAREAVSSTSHAVICEGDTATYRHDEVFDAGILSLVLHELEDQDRSRTMANALRHLSPKGCLIIVDFVLPFEGDDPTGAGRAELEGEEELCGETHFARYNEFMTKWGGTKGWLARFHKPVPLKATWFKGNLGLFVLTSKEV